MKTRRFIYTVVCLSLLCQACGENDDKTEHPPGITGLTATPATEEIGLSWINPSGGIVSVIIEYRNGEAGEAYRCIVNYPAQSWTLTDIEGDDSYYFSLRTVNNEGVLSEEASNVSAKALSREGGDTPVPMVSSVNAAGVDNTIEVSWELPGEDVYAHVCVQYTDPRTGRENTVKVDYPKTKLTINGVYREDGEFTFTLWTVGTEGSVGRNRVSVAATAQRRQGSVEKETYEKVALTVDMLSQNSIDPGNDTKESESVLIRLIDGDLTTYYMTNWRERPPMPHWVQIDLGEALQDIKIVLVTRHNANYAHPVVAGILVGNDGEQWTEIGLVDGAIPALAGYVYESPVFKSPESFTKLRFNVTETLHGYWGLAELELWKVIYND